MSASDGRMSSELPIAGRLLPPGRAGPPGAGDYSDTTRTCILRSTGRLRTNLDEVGVRLAHHRRSGGAGALTFQGFRKFIVEPARTRVFQLPGRRPVGPSVRRSLRGPHGIRKTGADDRRKSDIVKGIKCHAEVGGSISRWATLKLGKQASRETGVPCGVHWAARAARGSIPTPRATCCRCSIPATSWRIRSRSIRRLRLEGRPGAPPDLRGHEARHIGRGGHLSFRAARIASMRASFPSPSAP